MRVPFELMLTDEFIKQSKDNLKYLNCSRKATLEEISKAKTEKDFNNQNYIIFNKHLYSQDFGQGIKYILTKKNFLD